MQRIRQGVMISAKVFGLLAFTALALMVSGNCGSEPVWAQQGVIEAPEPALEATVGPVNMQVLWEYIMASFGSPYTAPSVLVFDIGIPDNKNVFHIQLVTSDGDSMHQDVPLDEMTPGGAIADDGLFHFIWFCSNADMEEALSDGCTISIATWVIAYDAESKTAFHWPERSQQ